jgi:3-deoxy-D-manno-octulosonic-acid transferase
MFIEIVKPKIALFTKYEFWYYYLKVLRSNEIPIYSFSSIFRENQLFFKPYGGFYKSFLKFFNHLFVQDNRSLQLLKSIGIQNVTVAGDTRFDRVAEICANVNEINVANVFKNSELCMVIGSSWPQDMSVLLPLINNEKIQLKYIIAPHEINKEEIKSLQNQINKKSVCFSEVNESTVNQYDVLFIDNIGMLSSLYQYGEMAYIGGAFGKGLHNVLEAATFGMPVIFGPKYSKFVEAINLIKKGVGFSINSSEELLPLVEKLCLDTIYRQNLSDLSKQFVQENTGGSALIVQFLKDENLI